MNFSSQKIKLFHKTGALKKHVFCPAKSFLHHGSVKMTLSREKRGRKKIPAETQNILWSSPQWNLFRNPLKRGLKVKHGVNGSFKTPLTGIINSWNDTHFLRKLSIYSKKKFFFCWKFGLFIGGADLGDPGVIAIDESYFPGGPP